MAYDEKLAQRVGDILANKQDVQAKKMFGGVCYLIQGNMACGILNDEVIVRVGKEAYEHSLKLNHTRKFDITGRAMTGWVMVAPAGHQTQKDLSAWIQKGIDFVSTLPPKDSKK